LWIFYHHFFFFLYKLLRDIELTRTRFVRVTSKSDGGGSSGSDGGSRPRREIDIIIILFFVWSVSQTSLCVYATTRVRSCTTVYHVVLSVVVFKSSSTVPSLILGDYPSNSNNNNNNYHRIRGQQCVCARVCSVGSIVAHVWYLLFSLFSL